MAVPKKTPIATDQEKNKALQSLQKALLQGKHKKVQELLSKPHIKMAILDYEDEDNRTPLMNAWLANNSLNI